MSHVWVCVVVKVEGEVRTPYAVATHEDVDGSITFTLSEKVWNEDVLPEVGDRVSLDQLRKGSKGWRAGSARFTTPEDEASLPRTNQKPRNHRNHRNGGKNASKIGSY